MDFIFRKARQADADKIWEILQQAILKRKNEGSNQWQDGYPNPTVVANDIANGYGFVLANGNDIAGYCAILINDEPAYDDIEGKWLTDGDFIVYHRVAIAENYLGKGLARQMLKHIDAFALANNIYSVKADTNFDNNSMLALFEKTGYVYCGEVYFRGAPRKAFEKVLERVL